MSRTYQLRRFVTIAQQSTFTLFNIEKYSNISEKYAFESKKNLKYVQPSNRAKCLGDPTLLLEHVQNAFRTRLKYVSNMFYIRLAAIYYFYIISTQYNNKNRPKRFALKISRILKVLIFNLNGKTIRNRVNYVRDKQIKV